MDYKLTQKSQEALSAAMRRAAAEGNPEVAPAHLLTALLAQTGGTAVPLLEAVGADWKHAARQGRGAARRAAQGAGRDRERAVELPPAAGRDEHRRRSGPSSSKTSTSPPSTCSSGLAADGGQVADLLKSAGRDARSALLDAFEKVRGARPRHQRDPEGTYQALEKYGVDLTERARDGQARPGHRP